MGIGSGGIALSGWVYPLNISHPQKMDLLMFTCCQTTQNGNSTPEIWVRWKLILVAKPTGLLFYRAELWVDGCSPQPKAMASLCSYWISVDFIEWMLFSLLHALWSSSKDFEWWSVNFDQLNMYLFVRYFSPLYSVNSSPPALVLFIWFYSLTGL